MALSRSSAPSVDSALHPTSLNAPPNPSQICAAAASSIVTPTSPPATSVIAPSVFQYASGADVISVAVPFVVPPSHVFALASTQPPLHSTNPDGHRQTPPSQELAVGQGRPQAPQFAGSVAAFTHARPHAI